MYRLKNRHLHQTATNDKEYKAGLCCTWWSQNSNGDGGATNTPSNLPKLALEEIRDQVSESQTVFTNGLFAGLCDSEQGGSDGSTSESARLDKLSKSRLWEVSVRSIGHLQEKPIAAKMTKRVCGNQSISQVTSTGPVHDGNDHAGLQWLVFSRNPCRLVHNQYGYASFAAYDSQSQLIFQSALVRSQEI
jgi:hypothetical protein